MPLISFILFCSFFTFSGREMQRSETAAGIADVTGLISYSLGSTSVPIKTHGYISSVICLFVTDASLTFFCFLHSGKTSVFALYYSNDLFCFQLIWILTTNILWCIPVYIFICLYNHPLLDWLKKYYLNCKEDFWSNFSCYYFFFLL